VRQGCDADPQLVQEYAPDILRSMLRRERHFMPTPDFMRLQPQLNSKMRSILNDWLWEVHRRYRLRKETLFLTVSVVDRYLSRARVLRQRFQLVGVTALLIAAKFEEIQPPRLADLAYVTDHSCTAEDIVRTEATMLAVLGFDVAGPTVAHFLQHLQASEGGVVAVGRVRGEAASPVSTASTPPRRSAAGVDVAWHLLELSLLDMRLVRHLPSRAASAALLLGRRLAGQRPAWPAALASLSGYSEGDLEPCAGEFRQVLEATSESRMRQEQVF